MSVDWFVIALLALALVCIAAGYMLRALREGDGV